tara:strand:+ start:15214 stop:16347 length:1134 start_codon:yes stop_codon:yes gene_type:complete
MFAKATHVGFAQRVVATLVASALLLWSIGVYGTAQAANITQVSDTLSDSDVSVVSDHTIAFGTPTGVANGQTITIDFSDGPFVVGGVDFTDIDVQDGSTDLSVAADCTGAEEVGAAFGGTTLTLTFCAGDGASIGAGGTTTIEIGLNATFGVAGDAQLTNPVAGSYEIDITAGSADTGSTRVAIIDNVLVTAIVETTFDFTITGLATSTAVNGTSTTGSTSPTTIPFGVLTAGEIKTLAQLLNVTTNANNGFVVTVQSDGYLQSANGAIIDGFSDGTDISTAGNAWAAPSEAIGDRRTWGHWGMTYEDDATVDLAAGDFIAVSSTTPREIFSHTGPADGTTTNIGSTTVGYQIEITPLQEAADDYSTILTYVATPTF